MATTLYLFEEERATVFPTDQSLNTCKSYKKYFGSLFFLLKVYRKMIQRKKKNSNSLRVKIYLDGVLWIKAVWFVAAASSINLLLPWSSWMILFHISRLNYANISIKFKTVFSISFCMIFIYLTEKLNYVSEISLTIVIYQTKVSSWYSFS